MRKIFFGALLVIAHGALAQIAKPINSGEIHNTASKLTKAGKYEEALAEYEKIDRNDTNYISALSAKANILIDIERYDEAIELCREGLQNHTDKDYQLSVLLGLSYLRKKSYEEALIAMNKSLERFPKSSVINHNKAVVYEEMGKISEALALYKENIRMNPYYPNAHLALGLLALKEGLVSQAMLALNTFLILEPNSSRALSILASMNEMVSSKYEKTPSNIPFSPEGGDDFSEQDLVITNYAALAKNYKTPAKTELSLIKQNHALISQLKDNSKDNGFWHKTYLPMFAQINKQNMFAGFSYLILSSSQNAEHVNLVKKNKDAINKFIAWAYPQIEKMSIGPVMEIDGEKKQLTNFYNQNNSALEMIGAINKQGNMEGYTEIYYPAGNLNAKGKLDANGKRTGKWLYYHPNGKLSEELHLEDGQFHGSFTIFHDNGNLKKKGTYEKGQQQGVEKVYNRAGLLTETTHLKDDILNGECIINYNIGDNFIKYKANFLQGKINETLSEYYDTGELASTKILTKGIANGEKKSYFRTGQLSDITTFENDLPEGTYKSYYQDGNLHQEGIYKAGNPIGKWTTYYKNGKISEEILYDEKGQKNGKLKYYDIDGKLYYEYDYTKGAITGYKYYDKEGKVIKEAKKQKGEFVISGFYPDGTIKSEGTYTAEGKKGLWKYYDKYGNLEAEENFNAKGYLQGKTITYYASGQVKQEFGYKDGKIHGYYVKYAKNGNITNEGWYFDGDAHGYWHEYYNDGTLETKSYYVKDMKTGYEEEYAVDGKLKAENLYQNGTLIKIVVYDTTQAVKSTHDLVNGTGSYVRLFPNNKVRFEGNYISGVSHGDFAWYNFSGGKEIIGRNHNNKRNGTWTWYYENGNINTQGQYVNGNKNGTWKNYYSSGKLRKINHFEDGEEEGESIWYYENGNPELKISYIGGKSHGDSYYYGEAGELQMIKTFVDGKVVSYSHFDKEGNMIKPVDISSGTHKVVCYFKNGNKSIEFENVKGQFEGKYIEYYEDGNIRESSNFKNDEREGSSIEYYPDGKMKSEVHYKNGLLHGPSKYYYPNGQLEKELNYRHNVLHGTAVYYQNSGKLNKTSVFYSGLCIQETYQ